MVPFLLPFLFIMAVGPNFKWIKDEINKVNIQQLVLLIISLIFSYFFIKKNGVNYLFALPLFALSFFLFIYTAKDLFSKKTNISQKISHFGFSLFILSVLLNGVLAKEFSTNMKVGEEIKFNNKIVKFENLKISTKDNYQALTAEFKIKDQKKILNLNPEIRIYNQPETITSEADISSNLLSDNFIVFNIINDDGFYNVRYQIKPFMVWIWISVILLSIGGFISFVKKND
tara:strand:- start:403 stop:1092 length:690 start_codon:yes stop_codon:yes gene_type:complete